MVLLILASWPELNGADSGNDIIHIIHLKEALFVQREEAPPSITIVMIHLNSTCHVPWRVTNALFTS